MAPFILRGITLAGIDAVKASKIRGLAAWARLARDLEPDELPSATCEIELENAPQQSLTCSPAGFGTNRCERA